MTRFAALENVADELSFPTSLAFDSSGAVYVAESGLPFDDAPAGGRVWRLGPQGRRRLLADGLRPPVNGLTFADDGFYVSEGGHPARIARLELDGSITPVVEGLPGPGNYHTNMVAPGPDGKLYFSQGALTNSGVVGLDAYELGWLRKLPHAHDIPGFDVVLTGVNVTTQDPAHGPFAQARTGAFAPFGTPTSPRQPIPAGLPATAAVMRCDSDGRNLELVAWGLRNAYGLGFLPDGRLLAIDQGADDRGSRPIGNAPDLLYEVRAGQWYGWPDFIGGQPVTSGVFRPERGPAPTFLLADHDRLPPPQRPLLHFPPHVAAVKFDVVTTGPFAGQLVVALFGDEAPMTAPAGPPCGREVVRVDPADWTIHPLLSGALQRPIDVRADPSGTWLYVLDFGHFEMTRTGMEAKAFSGRLCRMRAE